MTAAQTMKDFRERLGLTQAQAGPMLGYKDHQMISKIERGERSLTKPVGLFIALKLSIQ